MVANGNDDEYGHWRTSALFQWQNRFDDFDRIYTRIRIRLTVVYFSRARVCISVTMLLELKAKTNNDSFSVRKDFFTQRLTFEVWTLNQRLPHTLDRYWFEAISIVARKPITVRLRK